MSHVLHNGTAIFGVIACLLLAFSFFTFTITGQEGIEIKTLAVWALSAYGFAFIKSLITMCHQSNGICACHSLIVIEFRAVCKLSIGVSL